ncbi:MAG: S-adenosylmethionine decarboxylase [Betaproteobacteria bacterium]|nr:S-adenosylmethionine decarboxylase [Betaproteobacteria bacterium]
MIHLLLRLEACQNLNALKTLDVLRPISDRIMKTLEMNVVGVVDHQFYPFGVTIVYLLAESHCSIHTFWETSSCYIDLFSCKDFDTETATRLFVEGVRSEKHTESILHR